MNNIVKHPLDKGSFWFIVAVFMLFLMSALYDNRYLHWRLYSSEIFFYGGLFLFSIGCIMRVYCERVLKKQFSVFVAIQKEHQLITAFPYNYIRHPIYSAGILMAVGIIFLANSLLGLFVGIMFFLPALLYRIHVEEKALLEHFGKQYEDYKKETKALIPWVF